MCRELKSRNILSGLVLGRHHAGAPRVACGRTIIALAAAAFVALVGQAQAQIGPPNDYFLNAEDLGSALTGNAIGFNQGGSREPGEPLILSNPGGESVWYTWTAPADQAMTFDT